MPSTSDGSSCALIGVAALWTSADEGVRRVAAALGSGVGSSVTFYLWTSLGVWLQRRGTFHPAGLDGLLARHVAGLQFLRPVLVGDLVLVSLAATVVTLVGRLERVPALAVPATRPAR